MGQQRSRKDLNAHIIKSKMGSALQILNVSALQILNV